MYQAASPTARTPARPLAWLLVRFCRIIGHAISAPLPAALVLIAPTSVGVALV